LFGITSFALFVTLHQKFEFRSLIPRGAKEGNGPQLLLCVQPCRIFTDLMSQKKTMTTLPQI